MLGQIVRIIPDRGYGFLSPESNGKDIFFHMRALRELEFTEQLVGMTVEYDIETEPGGKTRAAYVRKHQ